MKTLLLTILILSVFLTGCVHVTPAESTEPDPGTTDDAVETTVPESSAPETTVPETTVPETTAPTPTERATEPTEETVHVEIADGGGVWDESDYQLSEPIVPQPGDTAETWNRARAAFYPEDGECSDPELLEKWMTVEGLQFEDLEERGCRQLILTVAQEMDGVETITVCYERQADGSWAVADGFGRMYGWVGGNGIMHSRLRETNTTPAGLWSIGLAFGNETRPEGVKMPWRDVTPNSDWVCDAESPYFNTWQERGAAGLEDWSDDVEHLENYQNQYAYACMIRFNTAPYTIPERGCAIFLHCSTGATGGCVGLPREDMLRTLLWLDPEKEPYILVTGYQLYENVDMILSKNI